MTIQDLGAIGELLGGVAVIASLLYLVIQVRHGFEGYKSNASQQVTNHFSMLQLEIAKNDNLLNAWISSRNEQPQTEVEQIRSLLILDSFIIAFENMYTQHKAGFLEAESYQTRRMILAAMVSSPNAKTWWDTVGRRQHPPSFVNEVDSAINDFHALKR